MPSLKSHRFKSSHSMPKLNLLPWRESFLIKKGFKRLFLMGLIILIILTINIFYREYFNQQAAYWKRENIEVQSALKIQNKKLFDINQKIKKRYQILLQKQNKLLKIAHNLKIIGHLLNILNSKKTVSISAIQYASNQFKLSGYSDSKLNIESFLNNLKGKVLDVHWKIDSIHNRSEKNKIDFKLEGVL